MTKIIFDYQLDGHNLEYLNHLYNAAIKDTGNNYVFSLPKDFEQSRHLLNWPDSSNIIFDFYDGKKVFCKSSIKTAWRSCRLLKRIVDKYSAKEIYLIWMISVLPFLPLFINKNIKVYGIIYRIYLYSWKESSWFTKLQHIVKYWILTNFSCIHKVFILNDNSSACTLNKIWHTKKFAYLADPYVPFKPEEIYSVRSELGIRDHQTLILHLGAMSLNKGTLTILNMIDNADSKSLENVVFVFAGKLYPNIKEEFYARLPLLQRKACIIVKDEFLPYHYMGCLVYSSDIVLLPYKRTDMSSGSIAYAAQFKKTVIVPQKGLLGKIVRKYHIGKLVPDFDDISQIVESKQYLNNYCESHTVKIFTHTILGI